MKLLNIVPFLVAFFTCSHIFSMNDNGMDCSQDGNNNAQIIKTISQQSCDDSQPTQPMDTCPDLKRVLELEEAIKKNNENVIRALIGDGVVLDQKAINAAIEIHGEAIYDQCINPISVFDRDEYVYANACKQKKASITSTTKIVDDAINARNMREAEISDTLACLKFPTVLEELVLNYKP